MPYALHQLAPGSYDLLLDGRIVGDVVRDTSSAGQEGGWCVELLDNPPCSQMPAPFTEAEHRFKALEEVTAWLGDAPITYAS